jgi:diketogulonate reductase-like aldo/keto reductase
MPKLLYGTAWKKERTADLVFQAVSAGFRGVDTACQPKHYHEAGVGEALRRLAEKGIARDALFLQTKFTSVDGQDPSRIPYDARAPLAEQVAQSFAASRKNLGVDFVDSLVLHAPLRTLGDTMTVWRAMEEIHRSGGARGLGISNCYDAGALEAIHAAAAVKPGVVQNRFYADTDYDKEVRAWCAERGAAYQSFWTLTANPHALADPAVRDAARARGKTPAQVWFAFVMGLGITPLTGTTSPEHMKQDLEAQDIALSPDEAARIAAIL